MLIGIGVALAAAGCGADDDEDDGPAPDPDANRSSLTCLERSTLSPEIYEDNRSDEAGIQPLLTPGAKGAEILTGKVAGVVIEYPDSGQATSAFTDAIESKALRKYARKRRIQTLERTLFIDYSGDPHVRKIVNACATRPDQPPPTP
jgi:hypothetical protein